MASKTKHKGRRPGEWIVVANMRGRASRTQREQFRCMCGKLISCGQAYIMQHFAGGKCR